MKTLKLRVNKPMAVIEKADNIYGL